MRSIKVLGALIVAILAVAATTAAAASAHEFTASKTGALEGMAYNTQVFTTNAGTTECEGLSVSGNVTVLKSEEQEASVTYENCSAAFGTVVEISLADYKFHANGTVDILAPILIDIKSLLGSCSIVVPIQKGLATVTYLNNFVEEGHLGIEANVEKIEYEGNGGVCGTGLQTNGTYVGTSLSSLVGGGTVTWA